MAPTIIFDKSAFQALSSDDHGARMFMFHENITPILLREIIGDIAKAAEPARAPPEQLVAGLARKFHGSGGAINVDWKLACLNELGGGRIPMTGQILVDQYTTGTAPDGSLAVLLEPTEGNLAVLRWAERQFLREERETATLFRQASQEFDVSSLRGRLTELDLKAPVEFAQLPEAVDTVLTDPAHQEIILDWLMDNIRPLKPSPYSRPSIKERWKRHGQPLLERFAPFANHCARALLMLLLSFEMPERVMRRPTNRLDLEYLLYLPFCNIFVSGDTFHRRLAPMLLGTNRSFVALEDFQADLRRLQKERNEADGSKRARLSFAFGMRPWPCRGSILWHLWEKHAGPWTLDRINRSTSLSQEERKQALIEASSLVNEARSSNLQERDSQ